MRTLTGAPWTSGIATPRAFTRRALLQPQGRPGKVVTTGQKFRRGYQITDENGQVQFTTIYPGWYNGRTIHIHVRVRTYSGTTVLTNFVTQIFFDETVNNTVLAESTYSRSSGRDTTNARDMVYNVSNATRMLTTPTGSVSGGYTAAITLGATFQTPAATAPTIASVASTMHEGPPVHDTGEWIPTIYGSGPHFYNSLLLAADLVNGIILRPGWRQRTDQQQTRISTVCRPTRSTFSLRPTRVTAWSPSP